MRKLLILAAAVLLLLTVVSVPAQEQPKASGEEDRGPGRPRVEAGLAPGGLYDEKTAQLERALYQQQAELIALLAAPEVDREKASAVHARIKELMAQLADRRFKQALEYKKRNPTWQPGFGRPCLAPDLFGGPACGGRR
ncbi:MAG: hypothetical protein AB1896_12155 [Thermodesulfobacteriota bacterium]